MMTVPTPIVTWETVVRLSDPIHKPSRQRLRTLKSAKMASDGIRVLKRSGGRASGSATYYSAVTALAAAVRQSGDERTAKRLSESGVRIETKFAELIRTYLQKGAVDELSAAPFYGDLLRETHKALDFAWKNFSDGSLIVGQVKGTKGDLTEIEADYQGQPARVDLPASLLHEHHIRQGDSVWILRRLVDSAALLMVLPAVSASEVELSFQEASHDAQQTPSMDDSDGERLGREYMSSGPGAQIRQAEADFFAAIPDDDLPTVRVLRLAG
jgi:hypothetical protein